MCDYTLLSPQTFNSQERFCVLSELYHVTKLQSFLSVYVFFWKINHYSLLISLRSDCNIWQNCCFDVYCQKLYEVHSQFSTNLRMATTHESVHTIADCFIMNKEKFLIYGEYCSNLLHAQDVLDKVCNTTPAVQSVVTVRDIMNFVVNFV